MTTWTRERKPKGGESLQVARSQAYRVNIHINLIIFLKCQDLNTPHFAVSRESAVQEVVAGLREYFNVMLGTQLLYKFERPHYADILQEHKDKQASDIYGFIHLIRLFGKFIESIERR